MSDLHVHAPDGVPDVRPGDDLVALLLAVADLADGDVVVVTSKVVSKAEGRVRPGTREDALAARDQPRGRPARADHDRADPPRPDPGRGRDRRLQRRGRATSCCSRRTPTPPPARSAPRSASGPAATSASWSPTPPAGPGARARPTSRSAPPGCSVLEEYAGRADAHGNELAVTAPAVADEIAGVAELAQGKLGGRPFAVVRGRPDLVLPPGEDGPGSGGAGPARRRRHVRLRVAGGRGRGAARRRRRRSRRSGARCPPTSWSPC